MKLIPDEGSGPVAGAEERKAIDVIVPVYKRAELTARCLDSLAEHIHEISGQNPRLVVINDSPGEADVQQVLESFSSRHSYAAVLENESNCGFVKTVNRGLGMACSDGRDVILVNADTETFPDTLKNLVNAAYADPLIAFASPRSNNASMCSLPHFYGGVVANQEESYRHWKLLSRTMPAFHFTPTAVGFYMYIKHAVMANFGFLDPEFGIGYEEENDLIFRANKVGYRAVLANNAFAYHAGSASFALLEMDLREHQAANLGRMSKRHEEFLPLVRRYEASAHYRAEALLSHALPTAAGRLKIVFDLSAVGMDFNGTNEMTLAILSKFYERHASKFEICVICSRKAFIFHKLDRYDGIRQLDPDFATAEKFAIGVRLSQPFSIHSISVLEELAIINVFGMLDTIADDCGYLSANHQLDAIWRHVSGNANGLFFISEFSERAFLARYPEVTHIARYSRLLPTKLCDYKWTRAHYSGDFLLVMGNHFAHKAAERTAVILEAAFPNTHIVVIGKANGVSRKIKFFKAGTLDEKQMESLYSRASVVVLPSYIEGFGFGLLHALAMSKVVVARDIPVTREILSTYKECSGVFLYKNDAELVHVAMKAMSESESRVNDDGACGWDSWVDGFAGFCAGLVERNDIFDRASRRIYAGDLLRKAELLDRLQAAAPASAKVASHDSSDGMSSWENGAIADSHGRQWRPVRHMKALLELDGEEFVYCAYVSLLGRLPDSDGLVNYLTELQSGISKVEIVRRLRYSTEWCRSGRSLAGYRWAVITKRLSSILSFAD